MKKQPRLHKFDRLARIYDQEILPIWSQRFGRMMLRDLDLPPRANVLDAACGTGYPSLEILRRLGGEGRIIAIDPCAALVDVARGKAGDLSGKRIFFRGEGASPRLSFADDVYDLVLCNLGIDGAENPQAMVNEFARVAKPEGRVIITLQLRGSFGEFYDLFHEVLVKHDRRDALERLEVLTEGIPDPETAIGWMETAGLHAVGVEVETFTLLFKSAREFFFSPLIEFGPLPAWKAVAGKGEAMQSAFWWLKEAIDAYFEGRAFAVTVVAGCLRGTKGVAPASEAAPVVKIVESGEAIEIHTGEIEAASILPPEEDEEEESPALEAPVQGDDEQSE